MSTHPPYSSAVTANLLIPGDLVPALRIPDVTVTTGEPGGVWCDRVWGRGQWSRRPVIRLPYDHRAAAKLRKRAVLDRVRMVFLPAYLLLLCWQTYTANQEPPGRASAWPSLAGFALVLLLVLDESWNPRPRPIKTRRGDLYLPDMPPAVADLWQQSNPGIQQVSDKPKYRRWAPWVYALNAAVCATGAAGMIWAWSAGADLPWATAYVAVALIVTAVTLGYLALPGNHERIDSARC